MLLIAYGFRKLLLENKNQTHKLTHSWGVPATFLKLCLWRVVGNILQPITFKRLDHTHPFTLFCPSSVCSTRFLIPICAKDCDMWVPPLNKESLIISNSELVWDYFNSICHHLATPMRVWALFNRSSIIAPHPVTPTHIMLLQCLQSPGFFPQCNPHRVISTNWP